MKALRACLLTSSLFLAFDANAIIILQNMSATNRVDYDNNVGMSNDPQSVWRYSFVPTYSISGVDQLNRWFARAGFNIQRSSDKNLSIDREDPNLGFGWDREFELGSLSITGNYIKTSTRISELQDSGLVANDASSISKSLSANLTRFFSEKISGSLRAGIVRSTFTGGSGLTSFNSKSLNSSISYEYSEKLRPFVSLGYSTFMSTNSNQGSQNSQTFSGGATYTINPRLSTNFSAGLTRLSTGVGKVGDFSLSYTGERYRLNGLYSRSVSPSSIGGFQNADSISFGYSYSLSETSNIGTDFSWRRNNSLNDIETKQFSAFYNNNLSEYWQMRLSMQARDIKSSNQSTNGEIIGISLIYNSTDF